MNSKVTVIMHSIFIIEDNLVNLKVTRVSLELEGFAVCSISPNLSS